MPWPETWDYNDLGGGRVLAFATGPQYVCNGVRVGGNDGFLQPDRVTSDKMMSDAKTISAVPEMIEYIKSSASTGCSTAKAILQKLGG